MEENYKHSDITGRILESYFTVYNKLGAGFREIVYERALLIELEKNGLKCEKQKNLKVFYDDQMVGNFYADIVVSNCVIVELKAVEYLRAEHEVQLVNYLRSTDMEVGLLLNFGAKPQYKRRVFANSRKMNHKQS